MSGSAAASAPAFVAALAHWDGQSITVTTQVPSDFEIADLWGTDANNVYAVGFGSALHWDGQSWTPIAGVVGSSISGSGPDDIWVGADDGLRHFDGATWTKLPDFSGAFVQDLVVAAHNDVYAVVVSNGITDIEHFDGQSWSVSFELPPSSTSGATITSIGASGPGDVWAGGTRFDPTNQRGYLVHFDGTRWTVAPEAAEPIQDVVFAPGFGDLAVGQQGGFDRLTVTPALGRDRRAQRAVAEPDRRVGELAGGHVGGGARRLGAALRRHRGQVGPERRHRGSGRRLGNCARRRLDRR